ncbi:cytochrome-c peroxidase [Bradyrhizobium prioriisuperbiae]|uniref:cytochrome-c peroxidase n=1 Tax=Bradyrhizobium prioriisuperbiae TaxID=2854389 RepID=UPI0028EC2629|nr:cytochrome c peroxidase [Bradyrhizobium prioritasuperba]
MERPRHARAGLYAILIAVTALTYIHAGRATSEPTQRDTPGVSQGGGLSRADVRRRVEKLSELGRAMFFDPALSSSGKMSCASCHDPQHGFSPANDMAVQRGGSDLRQAGLRAVPTLTYLQVVPPFTEHFFDSEDDADESVDNGPTGGLTWDGRVDRGRDQAKLPLLSPLEMGNADAAEVARRLLAAGYGAPIAEALGRPDVPDSDTLFATATKALEVFQQDHRTFYPYSSKYDAFLAGKATLTPQEERGLALFNDEAKGNCDSCHISRRGKDGTPPQFTDFGLIALGVPRNPAIPANRDPSFFDLGLCGPLRTDFTDRMEYCGRFRTPTLRNVALRKVFFHNGVFGSLRQAVEFYVDRDINPGRWFSRRADGSINLYDDLPDNAKVNVNTEPPFDRRPGQAPALNATEIDDIVVFLGTLTDGYAPPP